MNTHKLVSTSLVPPGGWRYRQPETGWKLETNYGTFEQNVQAIVLHRQANPAHQLSADYNQAASDLEAYMCSELRNDPRHCASTTPEPPKAMPPVAEVTTPGDTKPQGVAGFVRRFAGDLEALPTLAAWLGDGMEPVSQEKASGRARVCLSCPLHGKRRSIIGKIGDTIKKAVALKAKASLILMEEDELGTCTVCGCHLPLKVWVPTKNLDEEKHLTEGKFPAHCWIRLENDTLTPAKQNQLNLQRFAYDALNAAEPPPVAQQTAWPTTTLRLPSPGPNNTVYFNPSLWERTDGLWLMARRWEIPRNEIVAIKLDDNFMPGEQHIVHYKSGDEQIEDPRVVPIPGKKNSCIMGVTNYVHAVTWAHVVALEIGPDFRTTRVIRIKYGKNGSSVYSNTGNEKNWGWFFHEGALCFVYTLKPLVIVGTDGNADVTAEWKTDGFPQWPFGQLSGGTCPVRVGDEYFTFFHSAIWSKPPKRRYFMGCAAFSAKEPFNATRFTELPLLSGSRHDYKAHENEPAVYPCGAILRGKEWLVSMGVNDSACAIVRIPHTDLLQCMTLLSKQEETPKRPAKAKPSLIP